jgi:hypothetical protein
MISPTGENGMILCIKINDIKLAIGAGKRKQLYMQEYLPPISKPRRCS